MCNSFTRLSAAIVVACIVLTLQAQPLTGQDEREKVVPSDTTKPSKVIELTSEGKGASLERWFDVRGRAWIPVWKDSLGGRSFLREAKLLIDRPMIEAKVKGSLGRGSVANRETRK